MNQKLALRDGFQPCSTVKVPVALAALSESIVERNTLLHLYGRTAVGMTEALAKSNNQYFATLGQKLGFERVSYYARLFGLGEKAGFNIEGEQAGLLPRSTPHNGIGMMTSFGDGIAVTPLELAALIGAVANGGTLYYLQYPKTLEEAAAIEPRIKRRLDIQPLIPEIKPGLAGAVEYGTARRAGAESDEADLRQDRHLHGFALAHTSWLVRVLHRYRAREGRRGGAVDRCAGRQRSGGLGRGRQRVPESRRLPDISANRIRLRWPATRIRDGRYALASSSDVSSFPLRHARFQILAAVIEQSA